MVCIIDDRGDVWNYAPNLVHIKPYTWFKNVGDINSTYLPSSLTEITEENHQRSGKRKFQKEHSTEQTQKTKNLGVVADTDRYLYQLEIILKRIHKIFYNSYDQWVRDKRGNMPNLKQIMPNIRQQILKAVSLCFSHLLPPNYPLEKHRATIIAKAMGAKVTHDLQFDFDGTIQTTHVIAGKYTLKVHQALQTNIKVVTPEWLIDSYEQWEKKSEDNYILTSKYDILKSRLFIEEIPHISKWNFDTQQQMSILQQSASYQLNDFCINNVDHWNNTHSRASKRQCTTTSNRDD